MEEHTYDVLVIGGGAAGLSAALVLGRARRSVLVVDAGTPRNAPAAHMQGYLTRDGLPPVELLAVGRDEVRRYGVELVEDTVLSIEPGFTAQLASGRSVRARRILVATGATDELPDIPGARERWGRDFLHCPYCHGWEVRDEPIGVLSSVEHAQLLRQWSDDVVFFPHATAVSAGERAALEARDVGIADGLVTRLVVADDRLEAVALEDGRRIARTAVFIRPALQPRLVPLELELDELGFVAVDRAGATSVPGVWAAGNVANPRAQVITAAGEGSAAAIAINTDLVQENS